MNYNKLQKKARSAINSRYTAPEIKQVLSNSVKFGCEACAINQLFVRAKHDVFGKKLCTRHYEQMRQKAIDIRKQQAADNKNPNEQTETKKAE